MYRENPLPRKVLIVSDEVIAQAAITDNPSIRNIQNAIQIAEERFVLPVLGQAFYDDFREQKNVAVTDLNKTYLETLVLDSLTETATELHLPTPPPVYFRLGSIVNGIELVETEWYVKLWNEHLWKIIAEAVAYIASPTNWAQSTAAGVMLNNPKTPLSSGEGAASVELKDLKFLQDHALQNRIDPMISRMREWIEYNFSYFPKYQYTRPANVCGNTPYTDPTRKTGYINIYAKKETICRDF